MFTTATVQHYSAQADQTFTYPQHSELSFGIAAVLLFVGLDCSVLLKQVFHSCLLLP